MRNSNFIKSFGQIFVGVAVVVLLTIIADAFTEPTQAPPAGNVNPPLNTSGTTQTKTGNLTFPLMYDSDDGGYYVDPAANSWLYRIYSYDIRSDIFYDRNNTGYYIDPNSTSRMSTLNADSLAGLNLNGTAYFCFCGERNGTWTYALPWNSNAGTCQSFCSSSGSGCGQFGPYNPSNGSFSIQWNSC
ncbi:MAG: hypothetical protein AAB474_02730 [Patescibacteria group bacterium]